jgi:hypothetical protein
MLIDNLKPRVIYVGGRILIPGINQMTDLDKERLQKAGYWSSLEEMQRDEEIVFVVDEKPTASIIKKTYDEVLLKSWLSEAKAPLKAAIEAQLKKLTDESEGK